MNNDTKTIHMNTKLEIKCEKNAWHFILTIPSMALYEFLKCFDNAGVAVEQMADKSGCELRESKSKSKSERKKGRKRKWNVYIKWRIFLKHLKLL